MLPLILASASPRRAELLRQAGIGFEVMPADVDERVLPREAPEAYVRRVAESKAAAIAARAPRALVLGADTTVVVGTEMLGKPVDAADARRMLQSLSGRTHEVLTAVTLAGGGEPAGLATRVATTAVEFAAMTGDEIEWYVATGEPMDKAGAYAIQGMASRFVTRIAGSYSNVVGLPVAVVYDLLRQAGSTAIPSRW